MKKQSEEVPVAGRKMSSVPRNSNRRPSGRKPSLSERTMRAYGGSTISIKELQPGILDLLPFSPNPEKKNQKAGPSASAFCEKIQS